MTIRTLLIAVLAAVTMLPAHAEFEGNWFQVEVVIFEHTGGRPENPETWPTYPQLEKRSRAITLNPRATTLSNAAAGIADPFATLNEPDWALSAERNAIENSRNYRLLYHGSWVQPVPGRNNVVPIRIDAGDQYGNSHELQGYIELYVGRYLHVRTDLQLIRYEKTDNPFRLVDNSAGSIEEPANSPFSGLSLDQTASAPGSAVYNTEIIRAANNEYYRATQSIAMKQHRRMRSTELHYIDNPELGMLIYIVPLEN